MYAKFASVFALASVAVAAPVPQLLGLPLSAIPILGGLLGDLPTLPSLPIIGSLTVPTDIPGLPVSIPAIPTSIDITIPVAVPTALPLGEGAPKADLDIPIPSLPLPVSLPLPSDIPVPSLSIPSLPIPSLPIPSLPVPSLPSLSGLPSIPGLPLATAQPI